jgi:tRNA pseudouridine38-40 synthase
MVRIIAGTLIQVGAGMLAPEEIRRILNGCDRNLAGPTAPPEGLTLIEIAYEDAFTIMEQPNKE